VENGSGYVLCRKAEKLLVFLMSNPNKIHSRAELETACLLKATSRCCDTYISYIRAALGVEKSINIVVQRTVGYGWFGAPVNLVPVVSEHKRQRSNIGTTKYAVMTQADVGKRLGISTQEVSRIESRALKKLRAKPELLKTWREMLLQRSRLSYDPFHEIWLFSVADELSIYHRSKEEPVET